MSNLKNLPAGGVVVIVVILALFALAVALLFHIAARYRMLAAKARGDGRDEDGRGFRAALLEEFAAAYRKYGPDTNTPAVISDVMGRKLSGLLLCERYLNNAVSLFVTLGLFGTFLGLSLAVVSLTELIGYSNTSEWLSVLDSVGGGLLSALSGMGVAFYTSLVGAGCSIVLTILRTILNPQSAREKLETRLELWLDNEVAPRLADGTARSDAGLVRQMIDAMASSAAEIRKALSDASDSYAQTTARAADAFGKSLAVCDDEVKFGPFAVSCEDVIYRYRRKDWINSDDDITNSDFSLETAVLLRFTAAPWYKLPQDFNGYVRIVDDNGVEYDALEGGALEAWNRRVLPWATVLCVEFRYGDWPEEVGRLDVYLGQGSAERKLSVRLEDWELRDLDVLPREDEADPAAWKERLDYAWYASWDAQTELGAFAGEESGGIRLSMPRATLNTYPEAPEGAGEPSWDEPWNIFHGQAASCLLLIQGDMGKQPLSTVALRDRLRIVNPELGPDAPAVPCAIYSVEICRAMSCNIGLPRKTPPRALRWN